MQAVLRTAFVGSLGAVVWFSLESTATGKGSDKTAQGVILARLDGEDGAGADEPTFSELADAEREH